MTCDYDRLMAAIPTSAPPAWHRSTDRQPFVGWMGATGALGTVWENTI